MRNAIERIDRDTWRQTDEVGTVTLAFDDRHRRRIRMKDDNGQAFLLNLPEAEYMQDGDGLRLDGGGILRVRAAPEAVLEVRCRNPSVAARIAWHIGNRHVPLQVTDQHNLRIRADHVLADMVRHLGAVVVSLDAPFSPEPGAYSVGGQGQHDHSH